MSKIAKSISNCAVLIGQEPAMPVTVIVFGYADESTIFAFRTEGLAAPKSMVIPAALVEA